MSNISLETQERQARRTNGAGGIFAGTGSVVVANSDCTVAVDGFDIHDVTVESGVTDCSVAR